MKPRDRDWLELVKATRQQYGVSIEDAHDLILADEQMRRLVAWRVNNDSQCRKQAYADMRRHGDNSRFVRDGERIRFRSADGRRERLGKRRRHHGVNP